MPISWSGFEGHSIGIYGSPISRVWDTGLPPQKDPQSTTQTAVLKAVVRTVLQDGPDGFDESTG